MRRCRVILAAVFLLICGGPIAASAATAFRAPSVMPNAARSPCEGLLCDLTPNSMDRPITVADAARIAEAQKKLLLRSLSHPQAQEHRKAMVVRKVDRRFQFSAVHVVVSKDITSLAQLTGRPVSFGLDGDPTQALAQQAFDNLGIAVQHTPLDLDNALDGIATGDVAAAVVVRDSDVRKVENIAAPDLRVLLLPRASQPSPKTRTARPGRIASASN